MKKKSIIAFKATNGDGLCFICRKHVGENFFFCKDCDKKIKENDNYNEIAETEEEKKFVEILKKNKGN